VDSEQGYLVGNGCTDDKFDGDAIIPFMYGMGLISTDMFEVGHVTSTFDQV
jgi:serine carboxypeptidase-like clade 1